jgi:hypothetical protein
MLNRITVQINLLIVSLSNTIVREITIKDRMEEVIKEIIEILSQEEIASKEIDLVQTREKILIIEVTIKGDTLKINNNIINREVQQFLLSQLIEMLLKDI